MQAYSKQQIRSFFHQKKKKRKTAKSIDIFLFPHENIFMSTHNIHFHKQIRKALLMNTYNLHIFGEIRKILILMLFLSGDVILFLVRNCLVMGTYTGENLGDYWSVI